MEEEQLTPEQSAEIDKGIEEAAKGNYVKAWRDENKVIWRQRYENHEPVGQPYTQEPSAE